jgi:D-arabinose 1-dehydrogenase-like Zn-dependent alcohol dehydrogenase
MGCAGVATYTTLRHSAASSGDLVAVRGPGGLGHLGGGLSYPRLVSTFYVCVIHCKQVDLIGGDVELSHDG